MTNKGKFLPHYRLHRLVNITLILSMLLSIYPAQLWAQSSIDQAIADTREATERAATEPTEAVNPLSIALQQSSYQASGSLVVTYTVRNLAPPVITPDVDPLGTITDTIDTILATDFAADPNTVRNVLLTDVLSNADTSLIGSQPAADSSGDRFVLNLGDIPPFGAATAVVTMSAPASIAAYTALSDGAVTRGNWRARAVSAESQPIALHLDSFAPWLVCTIDANCNDSYVVEKSAELSNDPTAIFDYVRELGYETYDGSLRGARGTLWSEAGNGIDQASLLVALLRASGIPAGYHQGSLSNTDAATLINSMFTNQNTLGGHIPAGTPVADPASDPQLLGEAANHAWVEAYLPGSGWTMLDPSFAAATAGVTYTASSSGRIAELPDVLRHKVTLTLTVERYSAFPVGGTGLDQFSPLETTVNTVELIGEPVSLSHVVESEGAGGLVFATTQHTYTPYFLIGEERRIVNGTAFDDLLTSFPLASNFTIAEWLDITTTNPSGETSTYRRELFDDVGVAARMGGGTAGSLARGDTPRISIISSWNTLFAPSDISLDAVNRAYQDVIALSHTGADISRTVGNFSDTDNPSAEQIDFSNYAAEEIGKITLLAQRMHLLEFTASTDGAHDYLADATYVKAYADSPRIFTVGWERNPIDDTDTLGFDMLHNVVRSVPYPGQTDVGHDAYRMMSPLVDMALETQVLERIAPEPVISVAGLFAQAEADGLEIVRITLGNLEDLAALPLSAEAKTRIVTALQSNNDSFILVPEAMVAMPGALEPTVGWLHVDNETLAITDMLEDGTHGATGYAVLGNFSKKVGSLIGGFSGGFFATTMGFWTGFFNQVPITDVGSAIAAAKSTAKQMGEEAKKACDRIGDKKWCKAGSSAGIAAGMAAVSRADPPVNAQLYASPFDLPETSSSASAVLAHTADLTGSTVNIAVSSEHIGSYHVDEDWSSVGNNSFDYSMLSLNASDVSNSGGSLGSGTVSAISGTLYTDEQSLSVSTLADGSLSIYAPGSGINAASERTNYNSTLTPSGAVTLILKDTTLTLNGSTYSGDFTIASNAAETISAMGLGSTGAPNFAAQVDLGGSNDQLTVADAIGTLSVGGAAVSAENGFALADASGSTTVTPNGATNDVTFSGSADFFALELSSDTSSKPANSAATFNTNLTANMSGNFTTTVFAADGWDVSIMPAGAVTAMPAVGAAPGDYTIIVTAQSGDYPDLFVSAEHIVTVTSVDGVTLSVTPDPQFTVPFGPDYEVTNLDINGQFQLPDAAFIAELHNTSSSERTFDVAVSGLPTGWPIFAATHGNTVNTVTLAAGQKVELSLYVLPTVSDLASLVGNSYPFTIVATAQDDGAVTASDSGTFTVPATAYPSIAIEATEMYVLPNSSNQFTATLTNIGTGAGTFSWGTHAPKSNWSVSSPADVTLNPGESKTEVITYNVITGTAAIDHPVSIAIAAPTLPYTPTNSIDVYITSANATPIVVAGQAVGTCSANAFLEAHFVAIGNALTTLEGSCSAGSCNSLQRDDVVNAVSGLSSYLGLNYPSIDTSAASAAATILGSAGTVQANLDALPAIASSVEALAEPICAIAEQQPALTWSPTWDAAIVDGSVDYTLNLQNIGTKATTYGMTITLPSGDTMVSPTLDAGESISFTYALSDTVAGLVGVSAEVAVQSNAGIGDSASATLNIVDNYIQLTTVTATPDFVETGVSASTISIDVKNNAGIVIPGTAKVSAIAPSGLVVAWAETDVNINSDENAFTLNTFDTSGWTEGVYTITVDIVDEADVSIPDGSNYGLLAVGVGIKGIQSVSPGVVAPGDVTVTTFITTELTQQTFGGSRSSNETVQPEWLPTGMRNLPAGFSETIVGEDGTTFERSGEMIVVENSAEIITEGPDFTTDAAPIAVEISTPPATSARSSRGVNAITRYEESDIAITLAGSTTSIGYFQSSGGSYVRMDAIGETATFTTTSTWVNIGFSVGASSGIAEIYVDGVLTDTLDLYNHETVHQSNVYTFDSAATRVISITATDTRNAFANNDRVNLDYIDTWDGTPLPDGTFEQNDDRVIYGTGWSSFTGDAIASSGTYSRATTGSLWFPFTGDSVGFQTLASTSGGSWRVSVDGEFITTLSQYNPTTITRTLALDGFGVGAHVLHLESARGNREYIDGFSQPGVAPFYADVPDTGIIRYEEDSPAISYNDLPYAKTDDAGWSYVSGNTASDAYYSRSTLIGDVASLDFDGDWVGVGFAAGNSSGITEIFVDGMSQGRFDLYRWDAKGISHYFDGFGAGSHTISVTVTGDKHPFANSTRVNLDFFDTWDGTNEPTGTITPSLTSKDSPILSGGWTERVSGGFTHLRHIGDGSMWLPFTGDSVSFDAILYSSGGETEVLIDGKLVTRIDLYAPTNLRQTYAFTTTESGPHILQLRQLRDYASVEAFNTPAVGPFVDISQPTGLVHHEENHPAIRYNGEPLTQTETTFFESLWGEASSGLSIRTETLSDTISLTFDGSMVALGLLTYNGGGLANVYIDGAFVEEVDFYSAEPANKLLTYSLSPGSHTIELVALADQNPLSVNDRIYLDFIDTWDGTAELDGWSEFTRLNSAENVSASRNWNIELSDLARDGEFWDDGTNAWFRFTGESFSIRAMSDNNVNASIEIFIDGVSQGVQSTYYRLSRTPLIYTFDGLTDGPHIVRIHNSNIGGLTRADLDAFEANPTTPDPGYPMVEWEEIANTGGIYNTSAAGDIDEDGIVEIVATDATGNLIIYRGDGADATGPQAVANTPIEFMVDLGGEPDTVSLADLDGVSGSEIAVGFPQGFAVYSFDGTNWAEQWFTTTVKSDWRASSIGNIDADPEPEIVTTGRDCICILEADGSELIRINRPAPPVAAFSSPLPPLLADLDGDGRLDIITGDGSNLFVLTTTLGTPELWWTVSYTDTLDGRGTPAVADIDGHLPGGDDTPEIVFVTSQHIIAVEAENGDILWRFPTGGGAPGGVSIADLTGDGNPNIVATAQVAQSGIGSGIVFVLDAEGNEVWSAPAVDGTSANSASVLDLDGDGVWEVVWNGEGTGLTVWRGNDGTVLFNEPLINSATRIDYPIIVDVDGDNSAEIITGDSEGLYVVGFDNVWADSRPLWNQYNYHITNINDNLSVPLNELNNWDTHNTYRTQTPLDSVLPVYDVVVTHTVPASAVNVQSATAVRPFTVDGNPYGWAYEQAYYQPTVGNSFDVQLPAMQPGETRQVSVDTVIEYTLPSGSNTLTLPPLFVTAADIIALSPASQNVAAGLDASFTVTLTNPGSAASVYTPTVVGVPAAWVSGLPATVSVPANDVVVLTLSIATPPGVDLSLPFAVTVSTGLGGTSLANATLDIANSLELSVTPAVQNADPGETANYVLTIRNHLDESQTISLAATGLPDLTLPASVSVAANGSTTVTLAAKGYSAGLLPISVTAVNEIGISANADMVLDVVGSQGVSLLLNPDPVDGGPGMPSVVTVTVSNVGEAVATYDLMVDVPSGWLYELGQSEVTLPPFVLNSAEIQLILTPPANASVGAASYDVIATAQDGASRSAGQPASATATGTVNIGNRAVQIAIDPETRVLLPSSGATWNVTVTNTGSVQDTFLMTVTGIVALSGTFSQGSVTLDSGESTMVQLSASDFSFALPLTYPFAAVAMASTDSSIVNRANATIQFADITDVEVSYSPDMQTVGINEMAEYVLTITNTGNIATPYDVILNSTVPANLTISGQEQTTLLPAHSSFQIVVRASASAYGEYVFDGSAESTGSPNSASDTAKLIVSSATSVNHIDRNIQPAASAILVSILLATTALALLAVARKHKDRDL